MPSIEFCLQFHKLAAQFYTNGTRNRLYGTEVGKHLGMVPDLPQASVEGMQHHRPKDAQSLLRGV